MATEEQEMHTRFSEREPQVGGRSLWLFSTYHLDIWIGGSGLHQGIESLEGVCYYRPKCEELNITLWHNERHILHH